MKTLIPEKWKRPFRLALVVLLLCIIFVMNRWGIDFHISFQFKSAPTPIAVPDEDSRQTALEIMSLGYSDNRFGNSPTPRL